MARVARAKPDAKAAELEIFFFDRSETVVLLRTSFLDFGLGFISNLLGMCPFAGSLL